MSAEAVHPLSRGPAASLAFLFGCARSGTSIFGEILASHPSVGYVFEARDVWSRLETDPEASHRWEASTATDVSSADLRSALVRRGGGKPLILEKNPRHSLHIPFLHAHFRDAKLIHIVRDGRDVAWSMVPGIGGEGWHHLRPPSWRRLMCEAHGVVRSARAWREVLEIALADLAEVPHLEVRYEHLIEDAFGTARSALAFLNLPMTPEVEEFCGRIANRTEGTYQAAHQDRWFRPDHSVRVGRWREHRLRHPAEAEEVERILRPLLDRLGYP